MASATQDTSADTNGGSGSASIPVENPATGELITTIPVLGAGEVEEMAARARAAQPAWAALGFDVRREGDEARAAVDAPTPRTDHRPPSYRRPGRRTRTRSSPDLGYTMTALGFWAKEAQHYLADERVPSLEQPARGVCKKLVIRYAPIGVVGMIGPWNFPIANSFGDCIPALMAGNSVILKPSEVTR